MEDRNLFPDEIIENSQESNFARHSVRSKIIYTTVVLAVIGFITALPFIHLDVGVRSQGFIRPAAEVARITSPVSGYIQSLHISENSPVNRGDVVAIVSAPDVQEKLRFNEQRREQLENYISDLGVLQKADSFATFEFSDFISPRYRQSWAEFNQQRIHQTLKIEQLEKDLLRKKLLFDRNSVSKVTYDETLFERDSAINLYKLTVEQQKNQWRIDKTAFIHELEQLHSEETQLREELSRYRIKSPVTGTVQNSNGIIQNGFVYANQVLGEISPDTTLMADVYVNPKDIGLLHTGMPVRVQLDAYNQNHWGVAHGIVHEISNDMILNEGEPYFKVRCTLDRDYLELNNGFQGEIKKGMSLQARFIVANRSLFQLLYDRVDDWLNPVWGDHSYTVN